MSYRHPDFAALGLTNAPDCRFEPSPQDTTLPDGFMSTTNFPTYVKVGGRWRMPSHGPRTSTKATTSSRSATSTQGAATPGPSSWTRSNFVVPRMRG